MNFRTYSCSQINIRKESRRVMLHGWIRRIRKLGNLLFFDLYDSSGSLQIIAKKKELVDGLKRVNSDTLIKVWGTVQKKIDNDKQDLAKKVEISLEKWQIINQTKPLPFEIKDEIGLNEDTRYRYRYLDLRRNTSKKILLAKHQFLHNVRNFFYKKGFVEVETPILAQESPEGAHCFIVPSINPQRYYTLPQSPQIFKQFLMIGGFDKYYQIAKAFRNEDARSNRQIEFSQLDLECSFVSLKQVMRLMEQFIKYTLKKTFNYQIKTPFSILTYQEAIKKYGTDKPDLRSFSSNKKELNFTWIINWPLFEYNKEEQKYESLRHLFTIPQKKYINSLLNNKIKPEKIICEAFDLVCNGEEILSGGLRIYQRELQEKILDVLGFDKKKQEKHFGYFLEALSYGAPPSGGVGFGIDRLLAVILETKNLKELLAFPKNIDGDCSLTGTPNWLENNS